MRGLTFPFILFSDIFNKGDILRTASVNHIREEIVVNGLIAYLSAGIEPLAKN
jgi:hypothetical protein